MRIFLLEAVASSFGIPPGILNELATASKSQILIDQQEPRIGKTSYRINLDPGGRGGGGGGGRHASPQFRYCQIGVHRECSLSDIDCCCDSRINRISLPFDV